MRLPLAALLLAALGAGAAPAAAPRAVWPAADAPMSLLAAQFPNSAFVQRRLLAAALEASDQAGIRAALGRLADLGYSPTAATLDLLAPHLPEAEMTALRMRFNTNMGRIQASAVVAYVPPADRLVEGVAWDSLTQRLFVATVVGRALFVRDAQGWRQVPGLRAGSLFGLALDPRRGGLWRLLWTASGRVEQTPSPDTAFRGLIAIDRDRLREVRRIAAPAGASPGDIAIDVNGRLYASDPASGALYRASPGDRLLSVLIPPGRLVNPQAMVAADNGRWLYVSDYVRGLALVDLWHSSVSRLESDVATMLDGIDGLYAFRDGLIAVQNGTRPRRILFLRLSVDRRRIAGVRVLESNHEDWGEPTLGFVRGDEFLYVADSQWERYGAGGLVQGDAPLRPTAIRLLRP